MLYAFKLTNVCMGNRFCLFVFTMLGYADVVMYSFVMICHLFIIGSTFVAAAPSAMVAGLRMFVNNSDKGFSEYERTDKT